MLIRKWAFNRIPNFSIHQVKITWDDGHVSAFTREWLLARSFAHEKIKQRLEKEKHQERKVTWDASYGNNIKRYNFQDVMSSNDSLLSWLQGAAKKTAWSAMNGFWLIGCLLHPDLRSHGLTLIDEMESHPKTLRALLERIGFPKSTHYGEEFSVIAKPDPNNLAYTNSSLGLHVDLPFYQYSPGVSGKIINDRNALMAFAETDPFICSYPQL